MTTCTGTATTSDGSIIHYEARGTPSPKHPSLVFLHYYGGSPTTWAPLLAQTPFVDFHTVCYHVRGWAPSTGPARPDGYGVEAMSSDLSAILSVTGFLGDNSRSAGFVLVGHSMGAKVAQHYAATAADASMNRLKGLVLIAPAPLRGMELPTEAKRQQLAAYRSTESVEFVLDNVLTAGPRTLTEDAVAGCVRDSLRGNEWAKRTWPEYGMGEDYADLMDKIDVPVLVLRGDKDFERDIVGPLGMESGWINKGVENCGHLVPLEQPVQLGKEILDFFQPISQVAAVP